MTNEHEILIQTLIVTLIRARAIESLANENKDIDALIKFESDLSKIYSL